VSRASAGPGPWLEVGDRVFTRRYRFFDQQIGAILTEVGPVVVDTRSTPDQAREILADLGHLTRLPVAAVIDTHHHFDHAFGNSVFRPAAIWGHLRCAERIRATTAADIAELGAEEPEIAAGLAEVVLDPPDRVFVEATTIELGGRTVELGHLGRGHTDDDIVAIIPDAAVLFAGDLLENGAPPYFGDGFPLDWPATLRAVRELVSGAVVPGHGAVADLTFVDRSIGEIEAVAGLAQRVASGELDLEGAISRAPYPPRHAREPIERGVAQALGELDPTPDPR